MKAINHFSYQVIDDNHIHLTTGGTVIGVGEKAKTREVSPLNKHLHLKEAG